MLGWAEYDGPGIKYEVPRISNSIPVSEIARAKRIGNEAQRRLNHLMGEDGQEEFIKMIKDAEINPALREQTSLCPLTPMKTTSSASLSATDPNQWIRIDLTLTPAHVTVSCQEMVHGHATRLCPRKCRKQKRRLRGCKCGIDTEPWQKTSSHLVRRFELAEGLVHASCRRTQTVP